MYGVEVFEETKDDDFLEATVLYRCLQKVIILCRFLNENSDLQTAPHQLCLVRDVPLKVNVLFALQRTIGQEDPCVYRACGGWKSAPKNRDCIFTMNPQKFIVKMQSRFFGAGFRPPQAR